MLLLPDDAFVVVCLLFIFNIKTCTLDTLNYHNKASLRHLLQNKPNIEYFNCDKLKDNYV